MKWKRRVNNGWSSSPVKVYEVPWNKVKVGDIVFIPVDIINNVPQAMFGRHKVIDPDKQILVNRKGTKFRESWHFVYIKVSNIKYFGMEFQTFPASVYPTDSCIWSTLEQVKEEYEKFCTDCEKYGQTPLPHWLYKGTPEGDEDKYGYPDYPDYIIVQGKYGGISISKV